MIWGALRRILEGGLGGGRELARCCSGDGVVLLVQTPGPRRTRGRDFCGASQPAPTVDPTPTTKTKITKRLLDIKDKFDYSKVHAAIRAEVSRYQLPGLSPEASPRCLTASGNGGS